MEKGFASSLAVLSLIRVLCANPHLLDASNVGGEIFALLCPHAFDEDDLAASVEADQDRIPTAKNDRAASLAWLGIDAMLGVNSASQDIS